MTDTSTRKTRISRRAALTGAAATVFAAKMAFPSGAFAQSKGPETTKARIGFIALTDASPLIIAKERGIFDKYGLPDVEVLKQASWAATRDNLVLGSGAGGIDGAHILTPMPYLMTLGATPSARSSTSSSRGRAPTPRSPTTSVSTTTASASSISSTPATQRARREDRVNRTAQS